MTHCPYYQISLKALRGTEFVICDRTLKDEHFSLYIVVLDIVVLCGLLIVVLYILLRNN